MPSVRPQCACLLRMMCIHKVEQETCYRCENSKTRVDRDGGTGNKELGVARAPAHSSRPQQRTRTTSCAARTRERATANHLTTSGVKRRRDDDEFRGFWDGRRRSMFVDSFQRFDDVVHPSSAFRQLQSSIMSRNSIGVKTVAYCVSSLISCNTPPFRYVKMRLYFCQSKRFINS